MSKKNNEAVKDEKVETPACSGPHTTKAKLDVDMHCASCATVITKKLSKKGVVTNANPALRVVKVEFDDSKTSLDEIIESINELGYKAKEID